MALPAFVETAEKMVAEARKGPAVPSRPADVMSLGVGGIVKANNFMIDLFVWYRAILIQNIAEAKTWEMPEMDEREASCFVSLMDALLEGYDRPLSTSRDGKDYIKALEIASTKFGRKSADSRIVRHCIKRFKGVAEACAIPRERFLELVRVYRAKAVLMRDRVRFTETDPDRHEELFRQTIAEYPVINAYLAR